MNKIDIAKNSLKENKYTCVLFNGKKQIVSFKTGIKPLLYLTQKGTNLSGYVLADKIVGKAVALLALNLGIIEIFAETLSVSAKEILIKHNIAVSYETLTEKIINRQGTDICPMEKTVLNTFDPKQAFILLKNKVNKLKSKGENVMKSLVVYYSRAGENYFGNSLKNLEVGNTKVIADVTYSYDVTFYVDNTEHNAQIVEYGNKATTPTVPTKTGYTFLGWSLNGSDIADLSKLVKLKEKYNAILVVDEAHAFGIYGTKGLGISEAQNCIQDIDLIVATFGKAVGSVGAFCTGDDILINYLINKCRPLIFSTALPEINAAFSYCIITEILPNLQHEKKELLKTAEKLRQDLKNARLQTLGESHIVPVILGTNELAVKVSKELIQNGYYLLPIRHPTVAEGSSRIRISLRADISYDEIKEIPNLIKQIIDNS